MHDQGETVRRGHADRHRSCGNSRRGLGMACATPSMVPRKCRRLPPTFLGSNFLFGSLFLRRRLFLFGGGLLLRNFLLHYHGVSPPSRVVGMITTHEISLRHTFNRIDRSTNSNHLSMLACVSSFMVRGWLNTLKCIGGNFFKPGVSFEGRGNGSHRRFSPDLHSSLNETLP